MRSAPVPPLICLCLSAISLLSACDNNKQPACEEPVVPAADACIGGLDVETEQTATLSGTFTVLAIGTGAFPGACTEKIGPGTTGTGTWLNVESAAGAGYTVAFALDGLDLTSLIAEGDPVNLTADYTPGGFSATTGNLRLDSGAGAFLAWVGMGGPLSALQPPIGFTLQESVVTCESSNDCGTWQDHSVFIKTATQTVEAETGSTTDLADVRFVHGGDIQSSDAEDGATTCPDWFVSSAYFGARSL